MRITEVTVRVGDRETGASALAALLDLPLEEDLSGPFVRVGWTVVRPITSTGDGVDHVAVLLPGDGYEAGASWLLGRTPPLDGGVDLEGAPSWGSTSLYVGGPGGLVLELIAHAGHRTMPDPVFPDALLGVCEVGVAVPDVADAVAASRLPVFAGSIAPDFAAAGDTDGKLILATPGRVWLPTKDRTAGLAPLAIVADGAAEVDVRLGAASFAAG